VPDTLGKVTSPKLGPAKQWKQLKWDGKSMDILPGDNPRVDVIGVTPTGTSDTLIKNLNLSQRNVDISTIDAAQYPYLQLYLKNSDTVSVTPYQWKYWRLTVTPPPEGAIALNVYFQMKDVLEVGEPLDFK